MNSRHIVESDRNSHVRSRTACLLLAALLLLALRAPSRAGPLDNWHRRNPFPQGNTLAGIVYGNGRFVAVGEQGTVLTSADGINWVAGNVGSNTALAAVTFAQDNFVAVGGTLVFASSDAATWTPIDPGANDGWAGIAWGNGRFMTVAGGILSRRNLGISTNLVDWVITSPRASRPLKAIAYGAGVFRMVSADGWFETTDGSSVTVGSFGTSRNPFGLTYGNAGFVSVGAGGDVNGVPAGGGTTNDLYAVIFVDGMFVAVGAEGVVSTSTNAVQWLAHDSGLPTALRGVTFGSGQFVAVGDGGRIATSPDAVTWTVRSRGPIAPLQRLAYGNGRFIAVGDNGSVITSIDDTNWSAQDSGNHDLLSDICFNSEAFVAIGSSATDALAMASSDGTNWTSSSLGDAIALSRITAGPDLFLAVGYAYDQQIAQIVGAAITSPDGANWSLHEMGTNNLLNAVTYGNGMFVAVGAQFAFPQNQLVVTSPDGSNWVVRVSQHGPVLRGVAYGARRFVAVGDASSVLTSTDGISWQTSDLGSSDTLWDVAYGRGVFLANSDGGMLSSPDGSAWTPHSPPGQDAISFGRDSFFIVGPNGMILESDPLAGNPPLITLQPHSATNVAGIAASFTVDASGDEPLSYQWFKNGTNLLSDHGDISGTETPTLTLSNVQETDEGPYSVAVSNPFGSVTSSNAFLAVSLTPEQAIENLITLVNQTVERPEPFLASLDAALASLRRGNTTSSIKQIQAFQQKVHAQLRREHAPLAVSLTQAAQQVIETLRPK